MYLYINIYINFCVYFCIYVYTDEPYMQYVNEKIYLNIRIIPYTPDLMNRYTLRGFLPTILLRRLSNTRNLYRSKIKEQIIPPQKVHSSDDQILARHSEDAVIHRLSKLNSIFSRNEPFTSKFLDVRRYYIDQKASLVDDLVDPRASAKLTDFVINTFSRSRDMRALILEDLAGVLERQNYGAFSLLYKKLGFTNTPGLTQLIIDTANSGEPLLAALFVFRNATKASEMQPCVEVLMANLCIPNTPHLNYHYYCIIKLLQFFSPPNPTLQKILPRIINFMCLDRLLPSFANNVYRDYVSDDMIIHLSDIQRAAITLIEANVDAGFLGVAVQIWRRLLSLLPHCLAENIPLLASTIEKLQITNHPLAVEVVLELPEDLWRDESLLNHILGVLGTSKHHQDHFHKAVSMIKPPLKRPALSHMFSSFLANDNDEASQKVLNAIINTREGLFASDMELIIEKLLRERKVSPAISMCKDDNTSFNVSKLAFIRVFGFLLAHHPKSTSSVQIQNYEGTKTTFQQLLLRNLATLPHNDTALYSLTQMLITYLARHVSVGASRKLFLTHAYTLGQNATKNRFNFNNFGLSLKLNNFIRINKSNRIACIEEILSSALASKDNVNFEWAIRELCALGISTTDILTHFIQPAIYKSI